jgi:hypothetical protein
MIHKIKHLLIIFLFFIFSAVSFGADPGPPAPPPCPEGDPTVGRIENGVPIILGLALFYGAFKLQQIRRKLKEKENNT